ncbi:MAG TPA: CHASE2 domain-containing protein, partial [Sphingomicrobium sp.]|nr:CHASE2 domain-containing protein [Sphingomicrobium sp.]
MAVLVALSACLLSIGGIFDPAEDALTAWRAHTLTREPTGETVIVEIDARSLAELRSWPWPRRYHAEAVRKLHRSGASIIAFDVDFSARSDSGDGEFGAAIRDAGHVILPIFEQRSSSRSDDRNFVSSRPDAAFRDAWVGGVNIFPDDDGVVRDYPAATFVDGAIQPSIATLVAEKHGLGDRSFQPDWAIYADRIPRVSFVDVMKGRVSAETFTGKRVLIGATAIELGDRYAVPRYGVLPGVIIQALAAESLLQGRAIQRSGLAVTIAGIFLVALLLRPRALAAPGRYAALAAFLTGAALVVPLLAQRQYAIALVSAAWLFTVLAAVTAQIAVEARRRLRLRAEQDTDSGLPNRAVLEKKLNDDGFSSVLVTAAIERFDAIRDGIGFDATNQMIRNAAELVGESSGGPVYRISPDVLAWVMAAGDDVEVELRLNRLQSLFRAPVTTTAGPVDVSFTLGLARNDGSETGMLLIERALSAVRTARS